MVKNSFKFSKYLLMLSGGNTTRFSQLVIFSVAFGLGIFLSSLYIRAFLDFGSILLLFVLSVTLSAWVGGIKPGVIVTTLLAILNILYLNPILPTVIFLSVGILISYVIEKYKTTDKVHEVKVEFNKLFTEFKNIELEKEKALEEIKARDEFLSFASHELKTPLTTTLLKIQTALHNIRNVSLANFSVENLLKMLESAEQQTVRLSKMINDLLNVSLVKTGKLDLELEEVDLSKLVSDVSERFSEKLKEDGRVMQVLVQESVNGKMDRLKVEQVVSNLISNAIKYGENKPIRVEVRNGGDYGKIIVSDQGTGIDSKLKNKVFAKFERATEDKSIEGFGIGLYITSQIVEAHKGKIDLDTKLGRGSTFTVSLPLNKS